MYKKRRAHILMSWVLAGTLTVGMLSGCSYNDTSDTKTSSEETSDQESSVLQGHNEDSESNLGAWGRAMGSVLIAINEGSPYYFGGYAASDENQKAAANILEKSWEISSRKDLLKQIKQLLNSGSRKAYQKEAKEMDALSDKKLKKAMKQLSGPLLVHYKLVQKNWDTWGEKGLLAWDMCRISHLVQWGYIAGYLEREEAQAMIEPAAQNLKEQFDNWEDVIMNWLDGYALSASIDLQESGNDYEKREEVYQSLVNEQKEKGTLYDDSLFQTEIIPLSDTSYTTIMEEVKTKKKSKNQDKKNTKKGNKAKQQDADSEENKE